MHDGLPRRTFWVSSIYIFIYYVDVFAFDCPDQILSPNLETFDRPMEQLH